jgi:CubicO group peptidase (beta-lactamase class C family)
MTSAGLLFKCSSGKLDAPRAHDLSGKPQSPDSIFQIPAAYNPSGGVHVNIIDWATFVGVQLGQGPKNFLTSDTIKKLRRPYDGPGTKYGLGWNIVDTGPLDDLIQHDGTEGFWYASVTASPDTDRAVLVMTNRGGTAGERAVHQTVRDLAYKLYAD